MLLISWHLGLSGCYKQFPVPSCYTPLFNFLTFVHIFHLLSYLILLLFFPFHYSLSPGRIYSRDASSISVDPLKVVHHKIWNYIILQKPSEMALNQVQHSFRDKETKIVIEQKEHLLI